MITLTPMHTPKIGPISLLAATLLFSLGFLACDTSNAPPPAAGLQVSKATPTNQASDVPLDQTISLEMNQTIDQSTVKITSPNATLEVVDTDDGASRVDGLLSFTETTTTTILFKPSGHLLSEHHYSVTLKASVANAAGETLTSDYHFDFQAHTQDWQTPTSMYATPSTYGATVSASCPDGSTLFVYNPEGFSDGGLYAQIYSQNQFAPAEPLWISGAVRNVQAVCTPTGYLLAFYNENDRHVYTQRYLNSTGWLARQPMTSDSVQGFNPKIAADQEGNAVLLWKQYTVATGNQLWGSRYLARTNTWTPAARIDLDVPGSDTAWVGYFYDVALNEDGKGIVVFSFPPVGGPLDTWSYYSKEVDVKLGWMSPVSVFGGGQPIDSLYSAIALHKNGDAELIVPFKIMLGGANYTYKFKAVHYQHASAHWGSPVLIDFTETTFTSRYPKIFIKPNDDMVVSWMSQDSTQFKINVARNTNGAGWLATNPQIDLGPKLEHDYYYYSFEVDNLGQEWAAFSHLVGTKLELRVAQADASGQFLTANAIAPVATGDQFFANLHADYAGNIFLSWMQGSFTTSVTPWLVLYK